MNLKTYDVDSLMLVLPGQQAKEQVNTLNNLAVSLSFIDFDQSIQYAAKAMALAKDISYEEGKADAFRAYGNIYFYPGNYPLALNNFNEALSIYEKLEKKRKAGWICYDIARTHYSARNYEKTVQ
jgi:tetratricopeptide (TPR) repeat protein